MPPRFAAVRSRNFRLLWLGLLISHTGTWMASVGIGWTVYALTGSPLYLGLNSLAFAAPMLVLPIIGGVVADRVPRVRLMMLCQAGMMAGAAALALLAHTGHLRVEIIIALNFLEGVFLAFENPTRHALIPDLVAPDALLSAVSLAGASYQSAAFLGPALAGALLSAVGNERVYVLFYLNALSFGAVLLSLALLRGVPERRAAGSGGSVWHYLREGLRYVRETPATRTLIALALVVSVCGRSYVALLPVFARDILTVGARGLGFLLAAPGAGTIAGSLLLAARGDIRRRGRYYVLANLGFAACLAAFVLSRHFALSLVMLFAGGGLVATAGTTLVTMLQERTPPQVRGRVLSLITMTFIGAPSLGGLVMGATATAVGAPAALLAGAAVVATAMISAGARTVMKER